MKFATFRILFYVMIIFYVTKVDCQIDSIALHQLDEIVVQGQSELHSLTRLPTISNLYIYSGKKNEVIQLRKFEYNLSDKIGRQVFAKIPGVFVYDLEGSNMINISTRGLDPHRGWEFNIRRNGIIINSDLYAYPASHYSIPLESIEKIELVRGTGSLQYGAQLGGMLNYKLKEADSSKKIGIEFHQSIGSFSSYSSYLALSGRIKKLKYYTYFQKRNRKGYRDIESTNSHAAGINLNYQLNSKLKLTIDYSKSYYKYRVPGPLTDSLFAINPRQATRTRNYYSPSIHLLSLQLDYYFSKNFQVQWISSGLIGSRNSVLFDQPAIVQDTINTSLNSYNNRQVDIDLFKSFTHELKSLTQYKLSNRQSNLVVGLQFIHNHLHRRQLGIGTSGSGYTLEIIPDSWKRNIKLASNNVAFYAENNLQVNQKLDVNIGIRVENGSSIFTGTIVNIDQNLLPDQIKRNYVLPGISALYKIKNNVEFYSGISYTYRPVLFKDLIPGSVFERIDPNMKDGNGYNFELGYRGAANKFSWDINFFTLKINNRYGTLALKDSFNNFITYKTNIGNSINNGIELLLQYTAIDFYKFRISLFNSSSIMDGRYLSGSIKLNNENVNIKGNKIESVPNIITRTGINIQYRKFSLSSQLSYTSESYADALNSKAPNKTSSTGLVPSYLLLDGGLSYRNSTNFETKFNISNITNLSYFTKRPQLYPGPGIWPSDGRAVSLDIIFRF